ncbi:Uncharacterised protein [Mycobacteroides abscessus subsp. abscessus]|nr:Uncharacterised protein [Mycobacteroides abscessus subsp. abscessus]
MGLPSLEMTMSSSRVLTPSSRALAKARNDSSVVSPRPPRCACRSKDFVSLSPHETRAKVTVRTAAMRFMAAHCA